MRNWIIALGTMACLPTAAGAQRADTTTHLRWDAVIDAYYAYDFNRPVGGARSFATQPARHDEFNLNLALLRARLDGARVRASIGMAAGTYMEANYAAEPEQFHHLFEGYAGVNLGGAMWLDAGLLPSHIGLESAITPLNWTWSRSLMAEYSPYYETGVRLSFQPGPRLAIALLGLNGWQTVRETNGGKASGLQLQLRPVSSLLLNYSNYLGEESAPDPVKAGESLLRLFHDFWVQLDISERASVAAVFDIGTQERPGDTGSAEWYGVSLLGRLRPSPRWAIGLRAERLNDPEQAVVSTGGTQGFMTDGVSLNVDHAPAVAVLFRVEGRLLRSDARIWPGESGLRRGTAFIVTSLAVTF